MKYYRVMKVYNKVPYEEFKEKTGKQLIKVWWVDVNKGATDAPEIRSGLVANEI